MHSREKQLKILVLPSWYPTKIDPLSGDFVQRHVHAIASYAQQHVIHVVRDKQGIITKSMHRESVNQPGFTEEIIYYFSKSSGIDIVDKIRSNAMYSKLYKNAVEQYIKQNGKPDMAHVHIAMKAGTVALWLKRKFSIPFLITEHWSGYFEEADINFRHHNVVFRSLTKALFKKAAAITTVSAYLGKAIKSIFPFVHPVVVPNVVDEHIFFSTKMVKHFGNKFIHASSMNYPKNTEGILHAVDLLRKMDVNFTLDLYGPEQENILKLIQTLKLTNNVFYKGEVTQIVLADAMRSADALIMNSRFETFGCVIIEANACGLPVIVNDIPVFHELVTENENGYFVPNQKPEALAKKLFEFIQGEIVLDIDLITQKSKQYSYNNIGAYFYAIYEQIK